MKKILQYLRSMGFGILLLVLIALCSVAGSLIPQGKDAAFYAQTYRSFHGILLMLRLNRIFESWYFILLLVLLCLNLTLCSLVRVVNVVRGRAELLPRIARLPDAAALSPQGVEKLEEHLRAIHCRTERFGDTRVYYKNLIGRYGTFLLHLAILLTVLFGGAALYLPQVSDRSCLPGESILLSDGTEVAVDSFRIENDTGRLDFTSELRITRPNGQHREGPIRVNHPMSLGPWKIYQQTYGTAGSVTVTNLLTGGSDDFTLTDRVFLSLDGVNGLWYQALYPGYLIDPSGNMTLITSTQGSYTDPVYDVLTASDGEYTPILAFPGDELTIYDLRFHFNDPVEYPGLRIKHTPTVVNALLIASFLLMIAGIAITFFLPPVLVKVDAEGCAVGGPRSEGMKLELKALLEEEERKS